MKVLVSEKLSEHKYKTPEGYLICTDAILARTGKQSYTKDELFQDGDDTEVNVDRPYDEVMNAKTIASFENKPITFDHPDEDVNVGNYKDYAIGYVRDVRQGKTDKGEDVILGNLVITDQDAINAIEQGDHTDLSCGYDCDIKDDGNGNYSQTNIRGNHLALCEQGRAGIAHIVDSKVEDDFSKQITSAISRGKLTAHPYSGKYAMKVKKSDFENLKKELERLKYKDITFESNPYVSYNVFFTDNADNEDIEFSDSKARDMGWKTPGKRVPAHNEYSNSLKPEEMKSKLEKAAKDNKVDILRGILQELIADVDADLSNTSLDKDETIKHYSKYYVALRKANVGNMQGDVDSCLRELKRSGIHDSKEMTMSDAIKILNIVDAYKKVKDATWKRDNEVYYKFERGYWRVFSIYNRNRLDSEKAFALAHQCNVSIVSYKNEPLREDYSTGVWYHENYEVKGKNKEDVIKFCEKINPRVAPLKFEDSIKDASTDKWVIKNTGLAYEIWNQGKMVKKFPTKKQAIEWIHSRFPTDEITEDSTKDGRLWSTLTRKAKHR